MGIDSQHNADLTNFLPPHGTAGKRCPRFPIRSVPHWVETARAYSIIMLSHWLRPPQEEHDLSSKAEADLDADPDAEAVRSPRRSRLLAGGASSAALCLPKCAVLLRGPTLHTHVGSSSPWALQALFLRENYKREVGGCHRDPIRHSGSWGHGGYPWSCTSAIHSKAPHPLLPQWSPCSETHVLVAEDSEPLVTRCTNQILLQEKMCC